ncbi:MAG: ACT domain-containing protein [Planctomycetota bacterium]|jgi:hypothetical protein
MTDATSLEVLVHAGRLAIARLDPDAAVPAWADAASSADPLLAIARSRRELSLVTAAERVPPGVMAERDFRGLEVAGPLEFSLVGILARLTAALAAASIPVLAISTFDTDWLLVRESRLAEALVALEAAGVRVREA